MSKSIQILSRLALALMVIVVGNYVIVAQNAVTGDWTGNVKGYDFKPGKKDGDEEREEKAENPNKIHLSFSRKTDGNGKNQMGSSFAYGDLKGLTREQALSGGPVRFSLVREAGTLDCEGAFSGGKGSGTFVFTPNAGFVSAMKARGFDFEKPGKKGNGNSPEDRLFAAATINVTTALADDLLSANFGALDIDDLFKAAIFKVDSKFMREMKDSGFPNLGMEELVKARIFKIDGEFLRELASNGFANEPFESVVKMRIFKITPEFITGVRNEGFKDVDIEDLVKMKIFNINAEFIRQARADGVPMEVEKMVQRRIGVWTK